MYYNWMSEAEIENELLQLVKRREMDQKFLYMYKGAENYYSAIGNSKSKEEAKKDDFNYSNQTYFEQLDEFVFKKNKGKCALISLGCGSGFQEMGLLKEIVDKGYDVDYFANDSSYEMLRMAEQNLKDIDIEKTFIYGDFTSTQFPHQIHSLTKKYDYNIFAFLGCTFGNPNQTSVTDSLYNTLRKQDYLLLDLASREETDSNVKIKLFERYTYFLNNEKMIKFWFSPLEHLGVPRENGKAVLKTSTEGSIGAYVFAFNFQFTKRTVIEFKDEKIHCLPGEEIKLLTIRNYDPKIVKRFFDEHEFNLIDSKDFDFNHGLMVSQFLYNKK